MGKSKKRKKGKTKLGTKGHAFADSYLESGIISIDDIFPLPDEPRDIDGQEEADHVIDGYSMHQNNHHEYFNDDLGVDQNDYEVEQERYVMESEVAQPIAVDRYFKRFGKSRRTPR